MDDFLFMYVRLKKKIQEINNLALKVTPKEHSPFSLEHFLVYNFILQKLSHSNSTTPYLYKIFLTKHITN